MSIMKTDIEKVVKGLECCAIRKSCYSCPYFCNNAVCQDYLNKDALSLLKELKETKTVVCPKCGDEIEVKWSLLTKPDMEAIAKRDAFLSDKNGKKLQEAIDQIHLMEEIMSDE